MVAARWRGHAESTRKTDTAQLSRAWVLFAVVGQELTRRAMPCPARRPPPSRVGGGGNLRRVCERGGPNYQQNWVGGKSPASCKALAECTHIKSRNTATKPVQATATHAHARLASMGEHRLASGTPMWLQVIHLKFGCDTTMETRHARPSRYFGSASGFCKRGFLS